MSDISTDSYQRVHPATSLFSASNQGAPNNKTLVEQDFAHSKLSSLETFTLMDPSFDNQKRLEVAFSFMALGRKKAGSRELANVIKLATVLEKSQLLRQVGDVFMNFNEPESAYQCYREGLLHSKISKDLNTPLIIYLKSKIATFESDHSNTSSSIGSLIRYKEKTFRSMLSELSIHEKFKQELEDLRDMVADTKMAERCPFVKNIVREFTNACDLETALDELDLLELDDTSLNNFLNSLMVELFKFPDLTVYKSIFSSPRLDQVLTYLSVNVYEMELPRDFQDFLSILRAGHEAKEPISNTLESLEFQIKRALIYGCKQFSDKNYEDAKDWFLKVMVVCDILTKFCCMKGFKGTDKVIVAKFDQERRDRIRKVSTIAGVYSSLYAANSFIRYQDAYLEDLPVHCVEMMSLLQNLNKYYLTARYAKLPLKYDWIHLALGKLNEWLAVCKSKTFRRDSKANHDLKKLDDTHLECMISHYVRSLNLKFPDDPAVVSLYDKILWGALMRGGYHIQTLWVLKFFRDLSVFYSDTCLISYEDFSSFNIDQFKLKDYLDCNVHTIINKLYEQRKQLSNKQGSIFVSSSSRFIIPQFFYTSSYQLIASQEYTAQTTSVKQNFRLPGVTMKGILKADPEEIEHCNRISEQLLEDWSRGMSIRQPEVMSNDVVQSFFKSYYDGCKLTSF